MKLSGGVTSQTCIQEVHCSKLGANTNYPVYFGDFPQSAEKKSEIVLKLCYGQLLPHIRNYCFRTLSIDRYTKKKLDNTTF
jgi:hypothetical protein